MYILIPTFRGPLTIGLNLSFVFSDEKMSENVDPLCEQCGICSSIFVSKRGLLRHLKKMHDIQPQTEETPKSVSAASFSCYVCDQTFAQKWSVTRHLKNIHKFEIDDSLDEPQAFQCSICPKSYQRKKDLNKHVRRKHLGESFNCEMCGNKFTANDSLIRHLQKVHLVDMIKIKAVNEDSDSIHCQFCDKTYKNRKDLYHHMRLKHDTKSETDVENGTGKKSKLSCYICSGEFSTKFTLNRHLKKMHNEAPAPTTSGLCPLCDVGVKNGDNIIAHLEEAHEVRVESEKLYFNTFEEFVQWRDKMYVDTMSQFAKVRGVDKVKNGERMYLNCHHSGRYRGRGSGHRYRNPDRICKRGKVCPARLVVTCTLEGVEVIFYKTHVGHSNEPKYLRLTRSEREEIAGMLLNDIPHQKIIEKIRSNMPSSRQKSIKSQDLYNIRRDFNVDGMKAIMRTHETSLEISDKMIETVQENVWNVKLNNEDVYTVVLDSESKCRDCRYSCWVCRVCAHQFSCTCNDHLIDGNFCKHIHACVRLQKLGKSTEISGVAVLKEEQNYYIDTQKETDTKEASFIPQKIGMVNDRRQNLSLLLNASLGIISTLDDGSFKKAAPIIKKYIDEIISLKQEHMEVKNEGTDHIYSDKEIDFKEEWL